MYGCKSYVGMGIVMGVGIGLSMGVSSGVGMGVCMGIVDSWHTCQLSTIPIHTPIPTPLLISKPIHVYMSGVEVSKDTIKSIYRYLRCD